MQMRIYTKYSELTFWILALMLLAVMKPTTDPHYSFCIFKIIGLKFCPGCGLGHSISYLFHGDMQASFAAHPLGIFAVIIILARINKLLQLHVFQKTKNNKYGL